MIASSQVATLRALASRMRTRVARSAHKSEVLELIDLLDVALAEEESASPPAMPVQAVSASPPEEVPSKRKPDDAHDGGADALRAESDEMRSAARELTASMRPRLESAPELSTHERPPIPAATFRVGDRVRTTSAAGPFAGRDGEVTQITRFDTVIVRLDGPVGCAVELYHSADGSVLEPIPAAAPSSSLSRLATEGLELAARLRADALELEAWAARVRAAGGGR